MSDNDKNIGLGANPTFLEAHTHFTADDCLAIAPIDGVDEPDPAGEPVNAVEPNREDSIFLFKDRPYGVWIIDHHRHNLMTYPRPEQELKQARRGFDAIGFMGARWEETTVLGRACADRLFDWLDTEDGADALRLANCKQTPLSLSGPLSCDGRNRGNTNIELSNTCKGFHVMQLVCMSGGWAGDITTARELAERGPALVLAKLAEFFDLLPDKEELMSWHEVEFALYRALWEQNNDEGTSVRWRRPYKPVQPDLIEAYKEATVQVGLHGDDLYVTEFAPVHEGGRTPIPEEFGTGFWVVSAANPPGPTLSSRERNERFEIFRRIAVRLEIPFHQAIINYTKGRPAEAALAIPLEWMNSAFALAEEASQPLLFRADGSGAQVVATPL
jgi:hypothetical protein